MQRRTLDGGATAWQIQQLLIALKRLDVRLTFFITGEIFDWHPTLVERIAEAGHEIAFHTQHHRVLRDQADLENEICAAARFISAWRPLGFRAPAMDMLAQGYRVLHQAGFAYSSSVYSSGTAIPVDGLLEIPVSTHPRSGRQCATLIPARMTLALWRKEIPYGSGYVLGLRGWRYVHRLVKMREASCLPSNLFIHNWQLFAFDRRSVNHQYFEALLNPLHIPYARIVTRDFLELISRHRFRRLDTHPAVVAGRATSLLVEESSRQAIQQLSESTSRTIRS